MFSCSKKLISMILIFVIVVSYLGQTLEVVAATNGLVGFFDSSNIDFNVYFDDEKNEKSSNVNENPVVYFEITPNESKEGFLKEGLITASANENEKANFRFSKIKKIITNENIAEEKDIESSEIEDKTNLEESKNKINNEKVEENENKVNEEIIEDFENKINEEVIEESKDDVIEKNEENIEIVSRSSEIREDDSSEEVINEEIIIDEENEEENEKIEKYQVEIISDNEVKVQKIISKTIIAVEIEYVQNENLNVSDLYREVNINLTGKYINKKLEEKEEIKSCNIIVGWNYNKDIDVSSNYTKFSPYKVGEKQGSILENKISIKREIEDEKYLPLKSTNIEIDVPNLNGKKPDEVCIQANKLMATKGEDIGNIEFSKENWNYDKENGKVTINIMNENNSLATNGYGIDEFVVVYKYSEYVEEGIYSFNNNVVITSEEYSSKQNNKLEKNILEQQEINAIIGELISYTITTSEEKLNKGKVNANYNSETESYESEFSSIVNLNILTSDMFEELKIDSSKEMYYDVNNIAFEGTDIYYRKVKFNYNEVRDILSTNGIIEILNKNNEVLFTLNSESITNQESCEINLEGKVNGVYVVLKNVSINQNISIEFVKAISKSHYNKLTFNSFKQIESKVSATVKYADEDVVYNLSEISVRKDMENSMTSANISLANNNLTTIGENQNVEMKIELNNDKETSDLYVNPSFEVVFPKYVKEITVQNINVTYAGGLRIEDFQTYKENDIVKMRVNLSGVQTSFIDSKLTHGTNILITANIVLDEYTPSKKDQIKMYYCNEGVTNYESQTKWMISKEVNTEILKDTNGYDAEVINYQAPNGLVLANSIINYDGKLSTVKSIKQGEKEAKVDMDSPSRITTMELYVANNTGSVCNNIKLIGRVPFKNNKDVITDKNMGTTVTTSMLSAIEENITNLNLTTIYYSSNENATTDLENKENGWTTNVINWQNIKSYMIVVKGEMQAGSVLCYHYDFEIPENLVYDTAIYGSFGAYYNNGSEENIASSADKVGLKTEISIPIKINVESDVKDEVGESRYVNYTVTVENKSNEILNNIQLLNDVPEGTILYEQNEDLTQGKNGFVATDKRNINWTIEKLEIGQTIEKSYKVKVSAGMAEKTISNIVYAKMGEASQKSKVHVLTVKPCTFDIELSKDTEDEISIGEKVTYTAKITNITNKDEKNIKLVYKNPEELKIEEIYERDENLQRNDLEKINGENVYIIPELKSGKSTTVIISQIAEDVSKDEIISKIAVQLEDGKEESSLELNLKVVDVKLQVVQNCSVNGNVVNEGEEINILLEVKNTGKLDIQDIDVSSQFSEYLDIEMIEENSNTSMSIIPYKDSNVNVKIISVSPGETYKINVTAKVKDGIGNVVINNKWTVKQKSIDDIESNEMIINVISKEKNIDINEEIYSISGTAWVDVNQNGVKDDDDSYKENTEVQLVKDGEVIGSTITDDNGKYKFDGLEKGNYVVVSNYDKDKYSTTTYAKNTEKSKMNSNMYEATEGIGVTDNIEIINTNISNMDIGLIEKEKFDFEITESITKAKVIINNKEKEYKYDELDLAKVEIEPSDLKDAIVKLEYNIRVKNVGNIDGKVTSIVDYLPEGMTFNENDNAFWSLGTDGNIYYSGLKDTTIKAGDFQDVKIILQKKMSDDNTGVLSNKVKIAYAESETRAVEGKTNNLASQETIVTVTQGKAKTVVINILIISLIVGFGYMIKMGYFKGKFTIKKIYK